MRNHDKTREAASTASRADILRDPPFTGRSHDATLLFVDDEPALLRAVQRVVRAARPAWRIVTARHGAEALERLRERTVDVVVLDLQMPVMDGLTLLHVLRRDYPQVVRIVHSSHTESTPDGVLAELAHDVVPKPATPQQLLAVLGWALLRGQLAVSGADELACG